MKKSLVLATTLTFCLMNGALAANQFSSIPLDHWAYQSIHKLHQEGIIEDLNNADRSLTRYEAAQIVARAMTKNASTPELKKLITEFTPELNSLGVRIARQESKVDIGWEWLLQYRSVFNGSKYMEPTNDDFILRTRLSLNGRINNNWTSHIMLQNIQNMSSNSSGTSSESELSLLRAAATGQFDKLQVQVGRFAYFDKDAMIFNIEINGIQFDYTAGNLKTTVSYGTSTAIPRSNMQTDLSSKANPGITTAGLALDWQASKRFALSGGFYNHKIAPIGTYEGVRVNVYDLMSMYQVNDWKFSAMYLGANKDIGRGDDRHGYTFRIAYGGFDFRKKGSYLLQANYFKFPTYTYYGSPYAVEDLGASLCGAKGINIVADYIVEENFRIRTAYTNATDLSHKANRTTVYTIYAQFYF